MPATTGPSCDRDGRAAVPSSRAATGDRRPGAPPRARYRGPNLRCDVRGRRPCPRHVAPDWLLGAVPAVEFEPAHRPAGRAGAAPYGPSAYRHILSLPRRRTMARTMARTVARTMALCITWPQLRGESVGRGGRCVDKDGPGVDKGCGAATRLERRPCIGPDVAVFTRGGGPWGNENAVDNMGAAAGDNPLRPYCVRAPPGRTIGMD